MKVFRLRADYGQYRTGHAPGFVERHAPTTWECPSLENWTALDMRSDDFEKRKGDFLFFPLEFLICSSSITERLKDCTEGDLQVVPVCVDGESDYDLWNITNFVDCLDKKETTYRQSPFENLPAKWVFLTDRLTRPMLFRVPSLPSIPLLVTSVGEARRDFYRQYRKMRMTGIKFELVWERD